MKFKLNYLAGALLFLANITPAVELKVEGISAPQLLENVEIYLSQLADDEADGSARYQYLVQQAVDKALRAKGYYNTQYQFVRNGEILTLNVQLDQPVTLDEREVNIDGAAENDPDFINLIAKTIPAKGTVLNHGTYDGFKSDFERLAQVKGYFDGEWLYHRLEIYPKEHQADWRLGYRSGDRYRYGEIRFRDSQIREDYLVNMLRIKSGEPYLTYDLSKLSSDFSSSNWFSSVMVEPIVNEAQKTVDLNVLLRPKKKNDVEIGIGYVTDIGPRLQLNWKKPWINSRGHSIESNTYISQPEQTFEFGYNIPLKSNPLNYYYQISGGIERENQNDTKSTAAHLGFQRFWNHETGWAFSLGLKARYDAFEQASDKFKTFLLYPTASMNRTRSDGKRFPVWGDSQKITVNWGSKLWASDVNFYSIKASSAWIRTYFSNHRFYWRAEVGYLKSDEFYRLPPALRYFAGGDRSIRGFGYKKISPKNHAGELVGGTYLATGTFEYQYRLVGDWWGAAFYDLGLASNRFSREDLYHGAGLGVRWASPIGAIKLDLAKPVKSPDNRTGIQFYIGLGSEL